MATKYDPKQENLLIIVGNYGSGKTEIAVNLTLEIRKSGRRVSIADLDVVNPYFRCREAQELMRAHDIRVVIPAGAHQFADLPIVVPEVKGMLRPGAAEVSVFDVGGDDVGATLLSSFKEALGEQPYRLLQVINFKRPFTDTVEGCIKMKEAIEKSSRLRVGGYIVNTHLIEETTSEVILEGARRARELVQQTGVEISCVAMMEQFTQLKEIAEIKEPVLSLKRIMLPPWLRSGEQRDNAKVDGNDMPAGRTKPIFRP